MLYATGAELNALAWNEVMCRDKAGHHRCMHDCENCRYGEGQKEISELSRSERIVVMDRADRYSMPKSVSHKEIVGWVLAAGLVLAVLVPVGMFVYCLVKGIK